MKKRKLSKKSQALVDDFSECAKHYGWQEDQGTGKGVDEAEKEYNSAKLRLENRLLFLEKCKSESSMAAEMKS